MINGLVTPNDFLGARFKMQMLCTQLKKDSMLFSADFAGDDNIFSSNVGVEQFLEPRDS